MKPKLKKALQEFGKKNNLGKLELGLKIHVNEPSERGMIEMEVEIQLNGTDAIYYHNKGDGGMATIRDNRMNEKEKQASKIVNDFFDYLKEENITSRGFYGEEELITIESYVPELLDLMDSIKTSKTKLLYRQSKSHMHTYANKLSLNDLKEEKCQESFAEAFFDEGVALDFFLPKEEAWSSSINKENYKEELTKIGNQNPKKTKRVSKAQSK